MCGLALGAFVGGGVAVGVARAKATWVAGAVGLILSPWAVYTFYVVYPAVLWVPVGMLMSVFLFAQLGGVATERIRR